MNPTVPAFAVYNPGYAEANAQQIWGVAAPDIIQHGMTPQAAAESALGKIKAILAKYPVV